MSRFIVRRLLALIPMLFLVLVIVFSLVRLIPGDPAVSLMGPGATQQQIDALRDQLGLDQPVLMQFFTYVGDVLRGDLGVSLKTGQPVADEIASRLPATLELSVMALLVAVVVGIPIGVLSAVRSNTSADHVIRLVSLLGVSMPAFLLALLLQIVFGTALGWLPVSGRLDPTIIDEPVTGFAVLDGIIAGDWAAVGSAVEHLILPTIVLAAFLAASIGRYVRSTMLDTMGEDYIRTARAKGLGRGAVVLGHGLRNSLLPTVTVIGLQFADMLGGAILTETVFSWPGIGRYMFEAINTRDYPVIQGATLVFALLFVITSIVVDVLYGVLDPRVRTKVG
ncbi:MULTISPECIES: ABC transporter permease [unclassified Streptomyces]|uniref:ABC transporter permease n=1 Tax=unclassified Streptomyces TaxID=2593676 RepID=UPI0036E5D941